MKYWVFDLDGTLVDSFSHYFLALQNIFAECNLEFKAEYQKAALNLPAHEFLKTYLGHSNAETAISKLKQISDKDAKSILPYNYMTDTIKFLRSKGIKIAVWTSRGLPSTQLILEYTGLKNDIDFFITGDCVTQHKPHPEGLKMALKRFGCQKAEVVMVGDHQFDMMAAKAVGTYAIRASWNKYWKIENCLHADQQFYCPQEFSKWVSLTI